ncbi:MAG: cardiolipin synthase [Phycisphaerae bacterium]|nr:cardiolipin synthase [Phycisphaerae bacterium]
MPAILWKILSVLDMVLVAGAILVVLRRPREPRAMLAWILALLLLPVVGLILFLLIGEPRLKRTRRRRRRRREKLVPGLSRRSGALRDVHVTRQNVPIPEELSNLVSLATRFSRHAPTHGNEVTIYQDAEKTFLARQLAIEAAESHVHMEYYIFQPDETGHAVRDLLINKVRQGVQCRLLLDYVGCWRWPRSFKRSFQEGGVELAFCLPVVPWRGRWRVNFRNHRKLAVIDGKVSFTGSQNIGDEYLGRRKKLGPWRDTHMRIVGPAVHQLQEIFVEDWHYATKVDLLDDKYFPTPQRAGKRAVQVIASGPDDRVNAMHQLLFAAFAAAKQSICIATPYFVPDMAMVLAIQSAAYRGVRVRLMIPSRSDHRVVLWAARSYYEELAGAGVEIYEYDLGMLHSKVVVVDESWALLGSANMDERSFKLNFEVTTILYDAELARTLQNDFEMLLAQSKRVQPTRRSAWTFRETLSLGLARLASPLL